MAILPDEKQTKLTKPISTVGYFQMQQRAFNDLNLVYLRDDDRCF